MNAIKVENLSKTFNKTKAVENVSFEVGEGEVFGFLGPNGAGKTTTIRCLMNFIRPTAGEIKLMGLDSFKDSVAIKNQVGYLSSNVRLYSQWTGKDHIDFVASIHGNRGISQQLVDRLEFDQNKPFWNLSTGNKQKLGLILALMHEPKLIILDEPTSGLDPLLQNIIYQILEELNKKGSTIFISSHNLTEVERLCHKVGIIKKGKLVTEESIENLKSKRLHHVSAIFNSEYNVNDFKSDNVEIIEQTPNILIFSVKGDINSTLSRISKYQLKDLEITHGTLEDVFLEFYER